MNKLLCRLVVRFLLMTALADLLIGDSALLLYFSESRTRSRNSTAVPIFQNLSLFMSVLLCKSKVFLSIVAMIVMIKQIDNCF